MHHPITPERARGPDGVTVCTATQRSESSPMAGRGVPIAPSGIEECAGMHYSFGLSHVRRELDADPGGTLARLAGAAQSVYRLLCVVTEGQLCGPHNDSSVPFFTYMIHFQAAAPGPGVHQLSTPTNLLGEA